MASRYRNDDGEYLMTAAEMRFEDALDDQAAEERAYDAGQESRSGCGVNGCEAHDGECANNWGADDDERDSR